MKFSNNFHFIIEIIGENVSFPFHNTFSPGLFNLIFLTDCPTSKNKVVVLSKILRRQAIHKIIDYKSDKSEF
jgi:hypothetical protein